MRGTRLVKLVALAILLTAAAGQMTSAFAQKVNIFQTNSMWRYSYANPYVCLDGTGWEAAAFDDSSWPEAVGGFTGGETGGGSLVGVTTTTLPAPSAVAGQPASFRKHFNIPSTAGLSLILSNRHDDGIVIWINGTEVARANMTGNVGDPVSCATFGTDHEASSWSVVTLTQAQLAGILQNGDNVIAVSVFQSGAGSSDMVFAMQMWSEIAFPVSITSPPTSQTSTQCLSATFTVGASGSSPLTFQWFLNDSPIDSTVNPTATNQSLVLNNLTIADGGNYKVQVTNPLGSLTSTPDAVLTVTPDTTAPTVVRVIGEADLTTFTVTYSEPMDALSVTDEFAYQIRSQDGMEVLTLSSPINVISPTTIAIVTTSPRDPNKNYVLAVNEAGDATISEACNTANVVAPVVTPIGASIKVIGINDTQTWRYSADNVDPGPTWADVNFDDSAWPLGLALFADETAAMAEPIRTPMPRRVEGATTNIPAAFFRIHFSLPGPAAGASLSIRPFVDDALIVYLNGAEVYRSRVPAGTPRWAYSGGGTVGDAAYEGPFVLNVSNLVDGDNVLACQLYQNDATSSDWVFGIEVNAIVTSIFGGPVNFATQPMNQTINEGQTAALSVTAEGSQPITYQWQKSVGGGAFVDVPNQTGPSLIIQNATPADNGSYRVVANNSFGPAVSSAATLTVNPDLTAPVLVSAAGSTNSAVIDMVFSRPISAATGGNTANYAVVPVGGGAPLALVSATVNGTAVSLTTAPRVAGTSYRLTISNLRDTSFTGNLINPNPTTVNELQQDFLVFGWDQSWRYETNCTDGSSWQAPGFNDSAWPSGPGTFGLETSAGILTLLTNLGAPILTPLPVSTNIQAYYFRTTFNWAQSTAGIQFRLSHLVDDGATFYLNGTRVASFFETNLPPFSCTNLSSGGGEASLQTTNIAGVVTGQNLLAVEVHQQSLGSSDILMGAQLIARVGAAPAQGPRLTIVSEGANVRITWAPATGTLQYKNNLEDMTWTDVPGQVAGNTLVAVDQAKRFYTLRQ